MNQNIRATELRVIGSDGSMLGILTPKAALEIAENEGLDLVEVAPNAKPPTCKILDYGKYLYEQKKKAQESKKKQVIVTTKELQIRPRTDQHDIDTKVKHARKFILGGDKVRLNMRFRGREMAHKEVGRGVLMSMVKLIEDIATIELEPKMEGQQLFLIMSPDKKKIDAFNKLQAQVEEAPAAESPSAEA
ncbi:MAG: translation initiation factor IF-3 [Bdellovibrionales bacterium]